MKYFTLLLLMLSTNFWAQKTDEESIKQTINNMFDGMKQSDSVLIKQAFVEEAIMQTFDKNGNVKSEKFKDFVKSISKFPKGSLEERITFSSILIDGNLASVWTPYQFYYQDKFSHCGVNSFQLVKLDGVWKINYIIDTRRKDHCVK